MKIDKGETFLTVKRTLTGVVSGVASTAASGGEVLLLTIAPPPEPPEMTLPSPPPGVEGVDLESY